MDRDKLFRRISEERGRLIATLEGMSEEDLTTPGAAGHWSVKDVLAHISAWEEECLAALKALLAGKEWDVEYDIDHWNEQKYVERKGLAWEQVWEDFHRSYSQLCDLLLTTPPEKLNNEKIMEWISESTYDHYLEHCEEILAWRLKRRPPLVTQEA